MFHTMEEIELFLNERNYLGIKLGLDRVNYLLDRLNHPENELMTVHVAGTNGKGSTIQFLQNSLMASGYRVGMFTSPSFTGVRGHILVNGKEITEEEILSVLNDLLPFIHELDEKNNHPTTFEIITVLAIAFFSNNVDIALIETGMGGKDDTTNVVVPTVSIITNVSIDHQNHLGKTMEEITNHKAGIIKENTPVVVGNVQSESMNIIKYKAKEKNAPLYVLNRDFFYRIEYGSNFHCTFLNEREFQLSLQMDGKHQAENAVVAIMTLICLENQQIQIHWSNAICSINRTELPGRFEQVSNNPPIILDSAHNIASIKAFVDIAQTTYKYRKKKLLFAGFKDKQLEEMIQILAPYFSNITVTTFDHERAAKLEDLESVVKRFHFKFTPYWKEELIKFQTTSSDEVLFITGSLHFIIQVREYLLNNKYK